MASTSHQQSIHSVLLLHLSLLLALATSATSTPKGFSFELIHRDSPRSPLYPGNLTTSQQIERMVNYSPSYDPSGFDPEAVNIRPNVFYKPAIYMVLLSLGTGPAAQPYFLSLDTGSNLIWTQCEPCPSCFAQAHPLFDPKRSPTYQPFKCPHPLCSPPYQCIDGVCQYQITYGDQSTVTGILSTESFTFGSIDGGAITIPNILFGCTHSHTGSKGFNGYPEGILAMGQGPLSFATQLGNAINGRFSYCLPVPTVAEMTHLRFGDDIVMHGQVQRVPFAETNRVGYYYLNLIDISLDNQRFNLPPGTFARQPDGSGGFVIDSGSATSRFIGPVYDAVKLVLVAYFNHFNLRVVNGRTRGVPMDLCYEMVPNIDMYFPTMTLHFEGAELVILAHDLFSIIDDKGIFCLLIMRNDRITVLGAMQQHDIRFTYDLVKRELSFVRENCAVSG